MFPLPPTSRLPTRGQVWAVGGQQQTVTVVGAAVTDALVYTLVWAGLIRTMVMMVMVRVMACTVIVLPVVVAVVVAVKMRMIVGMVAGMSVGMNVGMSVGKSVGKVSTVGAGLIHTVMNTRLRMRTVAAAGVLLVLLLPGLLPAAPHLLAPGSRVACLQIPPTTSHRPGSPSWRSFWTRFGPGGQCVPRTMRALPSGSSHFDASMVSPPEGSSANNR